MFLTSLQLYPVVCDQYRLSNNPSSWLLICAHIHQSSSLQDRHSVVKRGEGDSPPSISPDDTNQTFKFSPGDGQALQVS